MHAAQLEEQLLLEVMAGHLGSLFCECVCGDTEQSLDRRTRWNLIIHFDENLVHLWETFADLV